MKRVFFILFISVCFVNCASHTGTVPAGSSAGDEGKIDLSDAEFEKLVQKRLNEISVSDFSDGFNHARYQYENSIPPYKLYDSKQILGFAENMVYMQNPDGGWAKNLDFQRVYSLSELKSIQQKNLSVPPVTYELHKTSAGSTMDNGNIHSQIKYLCQVYNQVKTAGGVDAERYLECAERGLDWILNAQHPVSGGFTGADVYGITYNDDVMSAALTLLRDISNGSGAYSVFSSETRSKAKEAYKKGIECILKTQITVTLKDGTKLLTAWGQQHYHENFQPRWAREFEPPSICSSESFKVLKLLMSDPNPTDEIRACVKAGVEFFDRDDVRLHDKKIIEVPLSKSIYWENVKRTDTKERIMVDDEGNRDLWARFYALDSSFDVVKDARKPIQGTYPEVLSPVWCDRGCKYVDNYMDISQERRTGYAYTNSSFNSVLTMYNNWKKQF